MIEPQPLSLAKVVHRAAEVVDADGRDPVVWALYEHFEDRDEPVTAVAGGVREELVAHAHALGGDPALTMAVAVAVYLAHRRDEIDVGREEILRLAARAEFDGHPPPVVQAWLTDA